MDKVSAEKYLRIAKINGVFGLDGWLKLYPYASFDQLYQLKDIILAKENLEIIKEARVEKANTASNKAKIKLVGIDTPEAAEQIVGLEIWADRKQLKLSKDEYPIQDIIGCDVAYKGNIIGKVDGIYSLAQDVLEIVLADKKTVMVPMVEDFVLSVDIANRIITVDRIDELL